MPSTTGHTIRTTDELWADARERAEREGFTINHVVRDMLTAYAYGDAELPGMAKKYGVAQ